MSVQNQMEHGQLGRDIDSIFKCHGVNDGFGPHDFIYTDKTVTDAFKAHPRISHSIVNATWPSIATKVVAHFTSRRAAEEILSKCIFRLHCLDRRVKEGELIAFARDHRLDGWLQQTSADEPPYLQSMRRMFYASFTEPDLDERDEAEMWHEFAAGPDGVRLTFKIEARAPDFRKIIYSRGINRGIDLINALQVRVNQFGQRKFVFRGMSRLAAFYLNRHLSNEQEIRLLHPCYDDQFTGVKEDASGWRYLEIPLDGEWHSGYRMTLQSIVSPARFETKLDHKFLQRVM